MNAADPRPPRAGAALLLVATFALGMIAGGALLHIARLSLGGPPPGGPPPGPPPAQRLQQELGLDAAQVERLEALFEDSRRRMRAEAEATRERIREILEPDQRERFDAMGPPPPPPGGPRPPRGRPGRRPPPDRPPPAP